VKFGDGSRYTYGFRYVEMCSRESFQNEVFQFEVAGLLVIRPTTIMKPITFRERVVELTYQRDIDADAENCSSSDGEEDGGAAAVAVTEMKPLVEN
jgi:hypothetical protein